MRRLSLSILALSTAITMPLLATAVSADDHQDRSSVYFGGTLNYLHQDTTNLGNIGENTGDDLARIIYKNDLDFSLFAGKEFFDRFLLLEAEYLRMSRGNDFLNVLEDGFLNQSPSRIPFGGEIHNDSFMANAWIRLHEAEKWSWYIGAGLGTTKTSLNSISTNGGLITPDVDGWGTSHQFMTKMGYDLSDNVTVSLGYRMHYAAKANMIINAAPDFDLRSKTHHVMARFTYRLGGGSKKTSPAPIPAPVVEKAPEPKPVIAPVVNKPVETKPLPKPEKKIEMPAMKEYIVFFDFDDAEVSATAEAILKRAKADFDKFGFVKIDTTGHTDSKGYKAYNQKLSLKRVRAVMAKLVEMGVSADKIKMEAKGENQLLIKTGDAVKEPQNRRVEIVLQR